MMTENKFFYIKETLDMGRGLYAKQDIDFAEIIHTSELVILTKEQTKLCEQHNILQDYLFPLTRFQDAMMLGYGVLFNGIPENYNVDNYVVWEDDRPMVQFMTNRKIVKDEQLFINYKYEGGNEQTNSL